MSINRERKKKWTSKYHRGTLLYFWKLLSSKLNAQHAYHNLSHKSTCIFRYSSNLMLNYILTYCSLIVSTISIFSDWRYFWGGKKRSGWNELTCRKLWSYLAFRHNTYAAIPILQIRKLKLKTICWLVYIARDDIISPWFYWFPELRDFQCY